MDFYGRMPTMRKKYASHTGMIVEIMEADGCNLIFEIEDGNGSTIHFLVSPKTYVVDFSTLTVGVQCTFWYLVDAPALLVYPPRFNAVVAALAKPGRMVSVGRFNGELVNEDVTLQLVMDEKVEVKTTNHQNFLGSIENRDLVVVYGNSTRSIPAQTTPLQVTVLCD